MLSVVYILLLFHSGLGAGCGGVTEINYRKTGIAWYKNQACKVFQNQKQNKIDYQNKTKLGQKPQKAQRLSEIAYTTKENCNISQ